LEEKEGSVGWGSEDSTAVIVDGCGRLTWTGAGGCTIRRGLVRKQQIGDHPLLCLAAMELHV